MKYRFNSFTELSQILESEKINAPQYMIKREMFISGSSEETVIKELDRRIEVTRQALIKGLGEPQHSRSGLTRGSAAAFAAAERGLVADTLYRRAVAYSLAINEVNACGGKVVSFPTAGSSGIVPGMIWAWHDCKRGTGAAPKKPHEFSLPAVQSLSPPYTAELREAFLISGLVGILISQGATLAGSEGGCQAECGSAGAMAACALSWLEGLPLDKCFSAAALSLKNSLGLACDPVAGLVEVPCVKRNAFVAVNALAASDMTLAGIESVIPFDEVVWAMKQIGDSIPLAIKETAMGGLALTPTGKAFKERTGGA
jgi:L-serine dehydratase